MRRNARRAVLALWRLGARPSPLPAGVGGVAVARWPAIAVPTARLAGSISSLAAHHRRWTAAGAAATTAHHTSHPTRRHARVSTPVAAAVEVRVAAMGESITEGSVAAILAPPGTAVEEDQVIAQIETDKVTIDVRAPSAGVVQQILVKPDETVVVGQLVAILGDEGKKWNGGRGDLGGSLSWCAPFIQFTLTPHLHNTKHHTQPWKGRQCRRRLLLWRRRRSRRRSLRSLPLLLPHTSHTRRHPPPRTLPLASRPSGSRRGAR